MNVYILKVKNAAPGFKYHVYTQAVVACDEREARVLANQCAMAEGNIWEDENLVSCYEADLSKPVVLCTGVLRDKS